MPRHRLPIIGYPLARTASEAVMEAGLRAAGSPIEIERWERKPHQLPEAIEELKGEDFAGALIAAPHKEKAAALADALSDQAKVSGAVNLLLEEKGGLRGHNSDVPAMRAGLEAILPKVQGNWPRQAVILGAGGAARAVVAVLLGSGFQRIVVFNRHLHRAEALVAHFARSARHMELRAMPWHEAIMESELSRIPLIVNASGIGVEEGDSPIPADLLPANGFLLDLVLDTTPLMREMQERGGAVANGQLSFLHSSAEAFGLLTGTDPPEDVMRQALAEELGIPEERVAVVGD
jgi:shikimate dehydrogenase